MRFLYLIFPLAIVMVSCEKDTLSQDSSTQDTELQSVVMEAIPDGVKISDIKVAVTDGMLSFASAQDYRIARHALSEASNEEYLVWQEALGFSSQYARYTELMTVMESQEAPLSKSDLNAEDRVALSIHQEKGLVLNYPNFVMAKLLNMQGRILIEGDLNQFTADNHILVDGNDIAKLEIAAKTEKTNLADGIIVQPFTFTEIDVQRDNQKAQFVDINCVFGIATEGTNAIGRTDEQTINGNREQLRTSLYLTSDIIVLNQSSGQYIVDYTMGFNFDNRVRKGLNWNHTYPNMSANYLRDRNSSNLMVDKDILRVSREQSVFSSSDGQVRTILNRDLVTRHVGLNSNPRGIDINGIGEGVLLVDELAVTTNFTRLTATDVTTLYIVEDGTISLRWRDRGNANDPVSVEYFCR